MKNMFFNLRDGVTLLSVFASGSVIPFGDVLGPTPTTDGISDLGESSYKPHTLNWLSNKCEFYIPEQSLSARTDDQDQIRALQFRHRHKGCFVDSFLIK